jgi:hypothetical protein
MWLASYSPEFLETEQRRYPAISHVCDVLGNATVTEVPIAFDCTDGFTEAFYGRPERFLDPAVRRAQSAWAFIDNEAEERAMQQLQHDLESGEWDRQYGYLREQPTFVGALRLITSQPS